MHNHNHHPDHESKTYTCSSCGSKSEGQPGTCCDGQTRKEVCSMCNHAHKDTSACDCGCGS